MRSFGLFGMQGPRWLTDPNTALYALWMMSIWGLGRTAIIFLAGLQDVPRELYEAAAIDGAGAWRSFSQRDVAHDHADHLLQPGAQRHRHLSDLHQRIRRHQRRPARFDALLRALHLSQRLSVLPHGLRLGLGLGALS